MTTQTTAYTASGLQQILLAAAVGLGLTFFTGLAGAEILHDAAHDTRHATGFPCH